MLQPLESSTSLPTVTSETSLTYATLSDVRLDTSDSIRKPASTCPTPDNQMISKSIDKSSKPTTFRIENRQSDSSIEYLPLEDSTSHFSFTGCSESKPFTCIDSNTANHKNYCKTLESCANQASLTANSSPRAEPMFVAQAYTSDMDHLTPNLSPRLTEFQSRLLNTSYSLNVESNDWHSNCLKDKTEMVSPCPKHFFYEPLENTRIDSEDKISCEYSQISVMTSEENFSPCLNEFLKSNSTQQSVCCSEASMHHQGETEYSPFSNIIKNNSSMPQVMNFRGINTVDNKTTKKLVPSTNSRTNIAGICYEGRCMESGNVTEALMMDNHLPFKGAGTKIANDCSSGAAGGSVLTPDLPLAGFKCDYQEESKPDNSYKQSVAHEGTPIVESQRLFPNTEISSVEQEEDMFDDMEAMDEEDTNVARGGLSQDTVTSGEEDSIDNGISLSPLMNVRSELSLAHPFAAASTYEASVSQASQKSNVM